METRARATETVRRRYDRIAGFYDFMEGLAERRFSGLRRLLWARVEGTRLLEVGVGTGKNFPYYPAGAEITAIDLSPRMLARARKKAQEMKLEASLMEMDVQDLQFEDNTFDSVVATFVFCSVPDPSRGLAEVRRATLSWRWGQLLRTARSFSTRNWCAK